MLVLGGRKGRGRKKGFWEKQQGHKEWKYTWEKLFNALGICTFREMAMHRLFGDFEKRGRALFSNANTPSHLFINVLNCALIAHFCSQNCDGTLLSSTQIFPWPPKWISNSVVCHSRSHVIFWPSRNFQSFLVYAMQILRPLAKVVDWTHFPHISSSF